MFNRLRALNFDLDFGGHAQAILKSDFDRAWRELEWVLAGFSLEVRELLEGGGGLAAPTMRLRRRLQSRDWQKHTFHVRKVVDGNESESSSHEIDHIKTFKNGTLALELEWNSKDTSFDRDLESFKRLHADNAISGGLIITRGTSFQTSLVDLIYSYCVSHDIGSLERLRELGIERTIRQLRIIARRLARGEDFPMAFSKAFISDKFGPATSHWTKLREKISRGAGGSCPLVLIGLPLDIIRP